MIHEIEPLAEGFFAVIDIDPEDVDAEKFRFDKDKQVLYYGTKSFREAPYFILNIRSTDERKMWKAIPELKSAYDHMMKAFLSHKDDVDKNIDAFSAFVSAVDECYDLTEKDREAVARKVRKERSKYITRKALIDTGTLTLEDVVPAFHHMPNEVKIPVANMSHMVSSAQDVADYQLISFEPCDPEKKEDKKGYELMDLSMDDFDPYS